MRRKFAGLAALMLLAGLFGTGRAAVDGGAAAFIRSLGNQALEVIRSNMAPQQKLVFFRDLLDRDFDMPRISRFVLGPYWRQATPAERQEFERLLSDNLVRFYDRRFAEYHGETLQVTGSRLDPAGVSVTSRIIRPNGPPIEVHWQLSVEGGLYKIGDVIIDGVSMAVSERADIDQQIASGGIGGLLTGTRMPEVGNTVAPQNR